jgi:hypothetical protein
VGDKPRAIGFGGPNDVHGQRKAVREHSVRDRAVHFHAEVGDRLRFRAASSDAEADNGINLDARALFLGCGVGVWVEQYRYQTTRKDSHPQEASAPAISSLPGWRW